METRELRVDGNAIAGLLQEIFVAEMTTARSTCGSCGAIEPIGALTVYLRCPGVVVRCLHCEAVQIRVVRANGRCWIDLSGVRSLELEEPGPGALTR